MRPKRKKYFSYNEIRTRHYKEKKTAIKKLEIGTVKKQDTLENQVNYVYLAFGSNLGDRKKNLNKALKLLNKENIVIKKKSKLYRSKSWPNEKFPERNYIVDAKVSLTHWTNPKHEQLETHFLVIVQ